jgi:hypothetical protein
MKWKIKSEPKQTFMCMAIYLCSMLSNKIPAKAEPEFIVILWELKPVTVRELMSAQAWGCLCSIKCLFKDLKVQKRDNFLGSDLEFSTFL